MLRPKLSFYLASPPFTDYLGVIQKTRIRFRTRQPVRLRQVMDERGVYVSGLGWEGDRFVFHVGIPR
jgi:hypothetical protein